MTNADFSPAPGSSQGDPSVSGDGSPDAGVDARIADLEGKISAAYADAEKLREDWLRARAETENVRRRAQEDVARAHRFGIEGLAGALLPVKDSLDAALTVENTSIDSFKEGVELTARQLASVLEKFSIVEVNPAAGEKFDPHRHEAISQVETDAEPNTVVSVLQKGYLLHDRVLRPALVVVSRARTS